MNFSYEYTNLEIVEPLVHYMFRDLTLAQPDQKLLYLIDSVVSNIQ